MDEKSLILVFKMVFPEVDIDELVNAYLWDPYQMRRKVPWNECAIKIDERVIILTFNMHKYSESNPTNYEVYTRLKGEIPANIPIGAFFDLSVAIENKSGSSSVIQETHE